MKLKEKTAYLTLHNRGSEIEIYLEAIGDEGIVYFNGEDWLEWPLEWLYAEYNNFREIEGEEVKRQARFAWEEA